MNNLVDELFNKNSNYQKCVICTYSFNAEFFENYLLNLNGLVNCKDICVFTDREIYNNHFDISISAKPKWVNKKYLLIPVDTSGIFHPKLYIAANDKIVRIGIGSSNITREGIANNLELISIFEISEKDNTYSSLLKECLDFLIDVAKASYSNSAVGYINEFALYVSRFLEYGSNAPLKLLSNIRRPILTQALELIENQSINKIYVMSPYYDNQLSVFNILKQKFPNSEFRFYVQQNKSNFPAEICNKDMNTEIYLFTEQMRFIHGKAIIFKAQNEAYLLTGSANFTRSAMLSESFSANVEAVVFGKIDSKAINHLCNPKETIIKKLEDINDFGAVPQVSPAVVDKDFISNWLIEAQLLNNNIQITLNEKLKLIPKSVVINDSIKLEYKKVIDVQNSKKTNLNYIYIEGYNENEQLVKSNFIWIINIVKSANKRKKRLYINNPFQIIAVFQDIIQNDSEDELIEYLLKFNIPLDLVSFHLKNYGYSSFSSNGNVFGSLPEHNSAFIKSSNVFDAFKHFINNNIGKLEAHINNIQLNKIDNFMLIFGTIFNMLKVFSDYLSKKYYKKFIDANDWSVIRDYYNFMLRAIEEIISFTLTNKGSYRELVEKSIELDRQQLLGNINTFSELIKRDYYGLYTTCIKNSKIIIRRICIYLDKCKVITIYGTSVTPALSTNGIRDTYIIHREEIMNAVSKANEYVENVQA